MSKFPCKFCASPLPTNSLVCTHCKQRNPISPLLLEKQEQEAIDNLMSVINYKNCSGIILDVCEEHGIWLDGGELRQIMDWYEVGGDKKIIRRQNI